MKELERTDFEEGKLLTVHKQSFLAGRGFPALFIRQPFRSSAQPHLFILLFPGERVNGRNEDFSEVHAFEGWSRLNKRGRPQGIAEPLRRAHLERFHVLKGQPDVGPRGKDFQPRPDIGIGVA